MNYKNFIYNLSLYFLASCLTLFVLIWIIYFPNFNYAIPFSYQGDYILCSTVIKSIMDTKDYVASPWLSAPSTLSFAVFPFSTPFVYVAVRFFSFFFKEWPSVINSVFLSNFFLTTLISLFVFRALGINKTFAVIASILFSFIPYHVFRGRGHLFISNIFVAPIFILIAYNIYKENSFLFKSKSLSSTIKKISLIALCIVASCSSSGGYFAFFGCFILLITGIAASIERQKWQPFLAAILFISISALTFIVSISPKFFMDQKYGSNQEIINRAPQESEIYSLKITQLLLPVDEHRLGPFRSFKEKYNSTAPLINENATATLGFVGSLGFLISLVILLIRRWQTSNNTLFFLAILNVSCLFLSVTGGFGAILAYSMLRVLRCYNRISVYISFISLSVFFIVLQTFLNKVSSSLRRILIASLAIVLLIIGLLDEIPYFDPKAAASLYKQNKEIYISDEAFIKKIEALMPSSSLIFQLPFFLFPESGPIYHLGDYEHFKAYLHSNKLRWSYGAYRGTQLSSWQQSVSNAPIQKMLNQIGIAGFTGLYINRNGYPDNAQKLEAELQSITQIKPITNNDHTIAFYDLRPYLDAVKKSNPILWNQQTKNNGILLSTNWSKGFYILESDNKNNWHWCEKKGELKIINQSDHGIPIKLSFKVQTGYPEEKHVLISGDLLQKELKASTKEVLISKQFILSPGIHTIKFKTDANKINAPTDTRSLYFRVMDFSMTQDNSDEYPDEIRATRGKGSSINISLPNVGKNPYQGGCLSLSNQ